jgi:purine-binding chemotaxis protein CheW
MVASTSKAELLAFTLVGEEYAIDILEIQEIIKLPQITSLPRIKDFVLGIVSLRGTIVPIVDLRKMMGLGDTEYSRATRVLVIRSEDEPIGIVVDGVTSVLRIERDSIEPKPRTMQRGSSEFFKGVGRVDGRLLIILDAEAVSLAVDYAI